jgi:hypothetical protein
MLDAVRAYFIRRHNLLHHSKDSLQARFIPGFLSGHFNRIDRSCAVAISAPDPWFPIWRSQIICCPIEASGVYWNKTIAGPVS